MKWWRQASFAGKLWTGEAAKQSKSQSTLTNKGLFTSWWGEYNSVTTVGSYLDWQSKSKPYCSPCGRTFPSQRALQQHYDDSASHHRCQDCGFDGSTWEKLLEHCRKTQHRVVCQGCDDGDGMTWIPGSQEYLNHLREENVCTTCEEHFQSPSNLDNVSRESVFLRLTLTLVLA
jgi:hypothetical protein